MAPGRRRSSRVVVPASRPGPSVAASRAAAVIAVALVSAPVGAEGAFEVSWPTARVAGLAGAVVEPAVGILSAPSDSSRRVAVDLVELSAGELFGLSEARGVLARGRISSKLGSAALEIGQLGGDLYRETTVGAALARPIGRTLAAEVGCRVLSQGAVGVAGRTATAIDAGIATRLRGRIVIVAAWRNVGGARIGGSPVSARSSLSGALVLDEITVAGSVALDPDLGTSLALGAEASLNAWLRLRGGVAVTPAAFAAGLGIGRSSVPDRSAGLLAWPVVDLAVNWHPELGGSTFATVTFRR